MPALPPDRLHFFFSRAVDDPDLLSRCRSVLSADEILKADRFRFDKDRHMSITARALLRFLLSEYTGRPPRSFVFTANSYGKPSLAGPGKTGPEISDLRFNLSHSSGMVVCGLALGREVGVDVENPDRKTDPDISGRFFAPSEAGLVARCPEPEKKACFYDIWTLKEAFIKARGKGLSIPLDSFSVNPDRPRPEIHFHDPGAAGGTRSDGWHFFRWRPQGATVAACVRGRAPLKADKFFCTPFKRICPA